MSDNILYNYKKKTNVTFSIFKDLLLTIFCIIILSSCVSMSQIKPDLEGIINKKDLSFKFRDYNSFIFVDVDSQALFLLKKGTVHKYYKISTSMYGTGNKENSLMTPLGIHKVSEKIGDNLPLGAILKGRVWTGGIANIITKYIDTDEDLVTSRILWLEGTEEGLNKGPGIDSKSRYIYIHGTAEEGLIGQPASDGCIRMYNDDVIELFSLVPLDTEVWIY